MSKVKIRLKTDYVRKDGTCSIYAQCHLHGRTVKLPTELYVEPLFWDPLHEVVKDFHPEAESMNLMIDQVRSDIFEIRKRYVLLKRDLTPEMLRSEYRHGGGAGDFVAWALRMIDLRKGEIVVATQRQHRVVLHKLMRFRKVIPFGELTPEVLTGFMVYMRSKLKNGITTVHSAMRVLKIYVKLALRQELLLSNPFDHVKLRKGKPGIVYLSEKERDALVLMFRNDYTSEKHRRVLLYFLFSCFTGLRISDIKRLRWDCVVNHTLYIQAYKTRRSTGETVVIPLGAMARWLLLQVERRPRNPYVFDVISEQKTNEYLKEMAALLGIRKSIHFHVARHTFATLFYEKTNDLATLQKLLGHAGIESTMVYAHVSDQLRRDQMGVFDAIV